MGAFIGIAPERPMMPRRDEASAHRTSTQYSGPSRRDVLLRILVFELKELVAMSFRSCSALAAVKKSV